MAHSYVASVVVKKESIQGRITVTVSNGSLGSDESRLKWEATEGGLGPIQGSLRELGARIKKGKKKGQTVMQMYTPDGKPVLFNFGTDHSGAEELYTKLKQAASAKTTAAVAPVIEQPQSRDRGAHTVIAATNEFKQRASLGGKRLDPRTSESRKSLLVSDQELAETYRNLGKSLLLLLYVVLIVEHS